MPFLDLTSLIFLAAAVFFFFKLRNALGKRTGHERDPYQSYSDKLSQKKKTSSNDNIVPLPKRKKQAETAKLENDEVSDDQAQLLRKIIAPILEDNPEFNADEFLAGAKVAYEMIVTAFANGDRKTLRPLLSSDVYSAFEQSISERENRQEMIDFTFIGIDKAAIISGEKIKKEVRITVRYKSEFISVTKNRNDEIVDGNATKIVNTIDIWTFARDHNSRDPNWKLVATETIE